MAISLKFRHVKDLFCILYRELNEEICKIKSSPNVFVFADKTDNLNKLSKDHHKELLLDNLAKTYQEAPPKLEASINLEAKSISTELNISNRVKHIARTPAFVTLKDQMDNICSNPMCCLINPSKDKLRKVSKQLVEKINSVGQYQHYFKIVQKHHIQQ